MASLTEGVSAVLLVLPVVVGAVTVVVDCTGGGCWKCCTASSACVGGRCCKCTGGGCSGCCVLARQALKQIL